MRFRTKDTIIIASVIAVFFVSGLIGNGSLSGIFSALASLFFGLLPLVIVGGIIFGISRVVSKRHRTRKEKVQIHLLQK